MKNTSIRYLLPLMLIAVIFSSAAAQAPLIAERPYEPVVLRGGVLSAHYGYPVNEVYLYAWDGGSGSWRMMPFQIDERIRTIDPNGDGESQRHTYFIADDGLIDDDDELVFMVRDMGEKAPERAWIPYADSKEFNRIELRVYDPDDPALDAYAYLYRSPTITEAVPAPYEFVYHEAQDSVESKYYAVGLGAKTGLVEDIVINPPFGTGVDIFDRQKMRASAVVGAGPLGELHLTAKTEGLLKLVPGYREATRKPVVRLVREVRQTFNLGIAELEEGMTFYVTTRFYPFSGRVAGGSALDQASLKEALPPSDNLFLLFPALRQSWDFSPAASGMRYYNKRNSGILVDGVPDVVDRTIERPIRDWNLITGEQGALFSLIVLPDTVADYLSLYYYDNKAGGTGDVDTLGFHDTGDGASWGDFGISMWNANSLDLSFEMYFLPASFNTVEQAQQLAHAVEKPVWVSFQSATGVAGHQGGVAPQGFTLARNWPNPFNQETSISFSLPGPGRIVVDILDARGRLVQRLAEGSHAGGSHLLRWDGRDLNGAAMPSGIYFCRLTGASQTLRQKLLLLR